MLIIASFVKNGFISMFDNGYHYDSFPKVASRATKAILKARSKYSMVSTPHDGFKAFELMANHFRNFKL